MKKRIILLLAALMCMMAGCQKADPGKTEASSGQKPAGEVTYKDGEYEGTGIGYGGKVKVKVVVADGAIKEVTVTDHREDAMYYNEALAVIDEVIETQSVDVDAVSGATSSSDGILSGIKDALKNAK